MKFLPLFYNSVKKLYTAFLSKKYYRSLNNITISSSAIAHNFRLFQDHKPNYFIIPVLKSNAYGHGLKQVAQIINTIPECKVIAVDSYPEYQIVHKYTDKDILIMGETWPENYSLFDIRRTHFAVRSKSAIEVLSNIAGSIKIHIFVNTGMNREGVQLDSLSDLLQTIIQKKNLRLVGVMSHLACADDKNSPLNLIQVQNFTTAIQVIKQAGFNPQYVHLEATAGMMNAISSMEGSEICTAGRLGIGLYGIDPLYDFGHIHRIGKQMRLAMDIYSTITTIQNLQSGDSVGYSSTWKSDGRQIIASFPFGYREGLDRELSGKSRKVYIGNKKHEIIGRISMNYSTLLVNKEIHIGDRVHVVSSRENDDNNIYCFYDVISRIPYEIVKLDDKVKRVIVD